MRQSHPPSEIISHLKALAHEYRGSNNNQILYNIIKNSYICLEGAACDNCPDGDDYVYKLFLYTNGEILSETEPYCSIIKQHLNSSNNYELISDIYFKDDSQYQNSMTMDSHQDYIKLFISHFSSDREKAKDLAEKLNNYGISAFVSGDSIQPGQEWQKEIIRNLQSMDVMLAFITDNFECPRTEKEIGFSNSPWTNQEIGFALGQQTPIISLKLENTNPCGFLATCQAMEIDLEHSGEFNDETTKNIIEEIVKQINESRFKKLFIPKFLNSNLFSETKLLFKLMKNKITNLSVEETEQIISAFLYNSQLRGEKCLNKNLRNFLKNTTGKCYYFGKKYTNRNEYHLVEKIETCLNTTFAG